MGILILRVETESCKGYLFPEERHTHTHKHTHTVTRKKYHEKYREFMNRRKLCKS